MAFFTLHGCLPSDKDFNRKSLTFRTSALLGCFHVAFGTLFKLLLALEPTEVNGLPLIGSCCGCILRVDFHSADGITHGRRLAFHESLSQVDVSFYFKGSALQARLAHSLVAGSEGEHFWRENHNSKSVTTIRKTIKSPPASKIDMGKVRIHAAK